MPSMKRTSRDIKSSRPRFPAYCQCSKPLSPRWGREVEQWLSMSCGVMTYVSSSGPELGLREVVKHNVHGPQLLRGCVGSSHDGKAPIESRSQSLTRICQGIGTARPGSNDHIRGESEAIRHLLNEIALDGGGGVTSLSISTGALVFTRLRLVLSLSLEVEINFLSHLSDTLKKKKRVSVEFKCPTGESVVPTAERQCSLSC